MKVAIICAIDDEARLVKQAMSDTVAKDTAGVCFTEGVMAGKAVVLCMAGIGKTNAAATTQLVINEYRPDIIINIGLAGNCLDSLPLGGAVVAERLVYHDFSMEIAAECPPFLESFVPDSELIALAAGACEKLGIPHANGTVATGDIFVESNALRDDIVSRTGAACVEMESAAVAHIAHKNGVRYAVVKLMSDNADDNARDTFHESLPLGAYCDRSAGIIAEFITAL